MSDIKTPELLETDRAANRDHFVKISDAAKEIDLLLIKHDLSWEEWMEVVNMIGDRTTKLVETMKMKDINEAYGRSNQ